MNLLIFFSIVFAVIVFAIILQRIIHCPTLVGFAFFSIFLIVSAVLNNITFVLVAIGLGILAFIVAFLDCTFRNSQIFRNNSCLIYNEENTINNNGRSGNENNNCCNCGNDTSDLKIVNNDGMIVARISGDTVSCRNGENNSRCGCRR